MTLIEQYNHTRARTESLCEPLQIEDYVPQPVIYASPPKWHLAHVSWFFEEFILSPNKPGYKAFDADFSFLFNSYYNNVGERVPRIDRGNITRPGVQKVYEYRKHIDEAMNELLQAGVDESIEELVTLGINHEQQHQELLVTDLKHTLSRNPLFPVYQSDYNPSGGKNAEEGVYHVPEGIYQIGFEGSGFHYDNELGRHRVFVGEYEIDKALVTNRQYLEFIEDGGYKDFNLWLDEAWAWVNENERQAPLYWYNIDGQWHRYTLAGLKPIDPDEILCHVNLYEALAFAEWSGKRLPTEFEWEIASNQLKWGQRWEWTNSAYLPYPGFTKAPGAVGEYNGKFMMNQMVLRGASPATADGHSRKTYRNFFHPNAQWQFSGIRLVNN